MRCLLSNAPLKLLYNNLNGELNDSSRLHFRIDGTKFTAKCFTKIKVIRKDHVNNPEMMGLLLAPLLGRIYKVLLSDIPVDPKDQQKMQTSLVQLSKFIHKFKIKFPVMKKFVTSQGVGSSVTFCPLSVDNFNFYDKIISSNDLINDSYLTCLFYFATLFGKTDSDFDTQFFHNYFFETFILNR